MKKHILKTLGSRALAAAIGAAMMIQANAPAIASAAQDKTEYIDQSIRCGYESCAERIP